MNKECFTDGVIVIIIGCVLMIEVPIGGNRSKQTQTLMFSFYYGSSVLKLACIIISIHTSGTSLGKL